jgi:aspartyl-tRNA(Asn)/glutamyl-tRNA(Gln) amidotransferase subunit B
MNNYYKVLALLKAIKNNVISFKIAETIIWELLDSDETVETIIEKKGLKNLVVDSFGESYVWCTLVANYGFLIHQTPRIEESKKQLFGIIMRESKGVVNPNQISHSIDSIYEMLHTNGVLKP